MLFGDEGEVAKQGLLYYLEQQVLLET